MSHNTLQDYYKMVYHLTSLHKLCSLTELENMAPYERDVYVALIEQHKIEMEEVTLAESIKQAGM